MLRMQFSLPNERAIPSLQKTSCNRQRLLAKKARRVRPLCKKQRTIMLDQRDKSAAHLIARPDQPDAARGENLPTT